MPLQQTLQLQVGLFPISENFSTTFTLHFISIMKLVILFPHKYLYSNFTWPKFCGSHELSLPGLNLPLKEGSPWCIVVSIGMNERRLVKWIVLPVKKHHFYINVFPVLVEKVFEEMGNWLISDMSTNDDVPSSIQENTNIRTTPLLLLWTFWSLVLCFTKQSRNTSTSFCVLHQIKLNGTAKGDKVASFFQVEVLPFLFE